MIKNNRLILLILTLSLYTLSLTTGCTYRMAFGGCGYRVKTGECQQPDISDADIMATSYAAADKLMRQMTPPLPPESHILVTSPTDIDNQNDTTSLSRLIGEQLTARFVQQGYTVVEAKQRGKPDSTQFADIIVTGTYAVGKNKVYITLKMLDGNRLEIISSYAYNLPIGPNTYSLLKTSFWWW